MSVNTVGRFRVLNASELIAPGSCCVCGTIEGQFVDFGLSLEFFGAVYFCFDNCFREAVNAFEYYSPAQHRVVLEENDFLRRENNVLKDQIEEMTRVFRTVTNNIAVNFSDRITGLSIDSSAIPVIEELKSYNYPVEQSKSGSSEQINEQGSSDVLSDDGTEEFIRSLDI